MVKANINGVPVDVSIQNPVVQTQQPVATAHRVVDEGGGDVGRWNSGEFDACDETVPTCLMSTCCPCFVVAQIAAKIKLLHGKDRESYWFVVGLAAASYGPPPQNKPALRSFDHRLYAFFYFLSILFLLLKENLILPGLWFIFSVVVVLVSFFVRISVAKVHEIHGTNCYSGKCIPNILCDLGYHFGFTLCSLTQMARQVHLYDGKKLGKALFLPEASPGDGDPPQGRDAAASHV